MAATTTMTITPLIVTSCSFKKDEKESVLEEIRFELPEESYSIEVNQEYSSQPINVQCYDQNGKAIQAETTLVLKTENDEDPPAWIKIDEDNQINIKGDVSPATYNFHLYAQDKNGKVKSDVKSFCVEMLGRPLLTPEEVIVECNNVQPQVCYSSNGNIKMKASGLNQDFSLDVINQEFDWSIFSIEGENPYDLDGESLFDLIYDDRYCQLLVSDNIDVRYVGNTYEVEVKASSVVDESIFQIIKIKIEIVNGFVHQDTDEQKTNYTYKRDSLDEPWALTNVPSNTTVIQKVLPSIYGDPVAIIADNLCSNNNITKLSAAVLPDSITYIGAGAFKNQQILYSLAMPGAKYIGDSAFENCPNMSLLNRPDFPQPSLAYAGEKAFYNCSSFSLASENVFVEIKDDAFYNTAITEIHLGGYVEILGFNCFSQCKQLKTIQISSLEPPYLSGSLGSNLTQLKAIKVPTELVKMYKNNPQWTSYFDIIVEI